MNKLASGFSVVMGIATAVVAVSLVGVGYYVYSSNTDKDATGDKKTNQPATNNSSQDTSSEGNPAAVDGYKAYEDKNVYLQHPDGWKTETMDNEPGWVNLTSADFKPYEGVGTGPTAVSGYWLEINVAKAESFESYENDLKNAPIAQEAHGGFYETIKIDGNNAVLSNTKAHGTYLYARAYKDGNAYYFRLNAPDEHKPEVKELFKAILATVKLK